MFLTSRIGRLLSVLGAVTALAVPDAAAAGPLDGLLGPEGPTRTSVPTLEGPRQASQGEATRHSADHPGSVPVGVNNFRCTPTAEHPHPVVLVHGSDGNVYNNYAALGPELVARGFCVFGVNFGGKPNPDEDEVDSYAWGHTAESAEQIGAFVERVRGATGAEKVDVISYSLGTNASRWWVNKLGGAAVTGRWITIAGPVYGSTLWGLGSIGAIVPGVRPTVAALLSPGIEEHMVGSRFLEEMNFPSDTVAGVEYFTINSLYDETITPRESMSLRGREATNILIQATCPENQAGHVALPYDSYTIGIIGRILDPAGAPDPVCVPVALGTGLAETVAGANGF